MEVQTTVYSIVIVTAIILIVFFIMNRKIKNVDPLQEPKGAFLLGTMLVTTIDNLVEANVDKKTAKWLGPYIGTIAVYIFLSNIIGLLGIDTPTSNYSVTLTLALISWLMIQWAKVKGSGGFGSYLKGFFEPIPLFFPINFFGTIGPLISMSLRMFGSILSGGIIMTLFYTFTGWLSSLVPVIGTIDFIGPFIGAVLHAYFDVFVGFLQMFIFIMLTMVFIGTELPEENINE